MGIPMGIPMGITMGIPTGENLIPIPMGMGIPMGIPIPTATLDIWQPFSIIVFLYPICSYNRCAYIRHILCFEMKRNIGENYTSLSLRHVFCHFVIKRTVCNILNPSPPWKRYETFYIRTEEINYRILIQ